MAKIRWESMIRHLHSTYRNAIKDKTIHKPMAYSLYQIWKFVDEHETDRRENNYVRKSNTDGNK